MLDHDPARPKSGRDHDTENWQASTGDPKLSMTDEMSMHQENEALHLESSYLFPPYLFTVVNSSNLQDTILLSLII